MRSILSDLLRDRVKQTISYGVLSIVSGDPLGCVMAQYSTREHCGDALLLECVEGAVSVLRSTEARNVSEVVNLISRLFSESRREAMHMQEMFDAAWFLVLQRCRAISALSRFLIAVLPTVKPTHPLLEPTRLVWAKLQAHDSEIECLLSFEPPDPLVVVERLSQDPCRGPWWVTELKTACASLNVSPKAVLSLVKITLLDVAAWQALSIWSPTLQVDADVALLHCLDFRMARRLQLPLRADEALRLEVGMRWLSARSHLPSAALTSAVLSLPHAQGSRLRLCLLQCVRASIDGHRLRLSDVQSSWQGCDDDAHRSAVEVHHTTGRQPLSGLYHAHRQKATQCLETISAGPLTGVDHKAIPIALDVLSSSSLHETGALALLRCKIPGFREIT